MQATNGDTPLHLAAEHRPDAIKAPLDAVADTNVQNGNGNAPLHKVAVSRWEQDSPRVISALVKAGTDVNIQNQDEETPIYIWLHLVARNMNMVENITWKNSVQILKSFNF